MTRRGRPASDVGRGRPSPPSSSSAACPVAARPPRRSCSRTSATRSSTTCRRAAARPRRARGLGPQRVRARRDRPRRARRRRDDGPRRDARALEGRGIRPQVVFLEASDDVLIRRFSETRHRHPLGDERGIADPIAERTAPARPSAPRRTSSSTRPTCPPPAARAPLRRARDVRPSATSSRSSHQLRLQARRPARGRTSSSTSASWRTRSISPSCARSPG